jgi:hypothetical protein
LFGDIDLAQPESLYNCAVHVASFAGQEHIDVTAIHAMSPRKGGLTPLKVNHGSQQANNGICIKYYRWSAEAFDFTLQILPAVRHSNLPPRRVSQRALSDY